LATGGQSSRAGSLPQGLVYTCKKLVGWQAAFAGKPAPTGFGVHLQEIGRLAGRLRWQASSHRVWCTPARDWSVGGPPSPAGQLPQGLVYICKKLVGWQAAFAGKPAPTGFGVHLREIGRLAGRHRRQASSHNKNRSTPPALHHSTGRAVARLQLLIYPPLRQAEWRRSSGGRRVAPFDEVEHIERRSSRSRPEAMPPDECRNEGTPSPSEGPDVGASVFLLTFFRRL
jgi:hypothetical protein